MKGWRPSVPRGTPHMLRLKRSRRTRVDFCPRASLANDLDVFLVQRRNFIGTCESGPMCESYLLFILRLEIIGYTLPACSLLSCFGRVE